MQEVIDIMNKKGVIIEMPKRGYRYRLVDGHKNPLKYIHGKTFKGLLKKT
jgi:hypothetical protein